MSAGMMDKLGMPNVDRQLMTGGAYPMPLNHIRCCALSILRLGAENYWNWFLQIIMEACMPDFPVCYLHQNCKTFNSYAHKICNNGYLPGDIHFYDINFQIFCKMSFLLHLRLSLTMWFIVSFKRFLWCPFDVVWIVEVCILPDFNIMHLCLLQGEYYGLLHSVYFTFQYSK